jgi:hypothetical protein
MPAKDAQLVIKTMLQLTRTAKPWPGAPGPDEDNAQQAAAQDASEGEAC